MASSLIVIRAATAADLPALGRLGASLMRLHHAFDAQRFLPPGDDPEGGYAWFLAQQLEDPHAVVFVAEQDGLVVGYVYTGIEPLSWKELRDRAGFIHDLLVADDARGHGVGLRLIEEAVGWLRARHVPRVILWTAEQNAVAQRLFARAGFRRTMVEMTREV